NDALETFMHYEDDKRDTGFMPMKLYYNNNYYIVFTLTPPLEYIVIREDGAVPFYEDARKITIIALGFDTKEKNMNNIGKEWLNSSAKVLFRRLIDILEGLKQKLDSDIRGDVLQSVNAFIEMAERSLHEQKEIERTVKEGLDYTENVKQQDVLTKEDEVYLEQNKEATMRAMSRKNMIQMKTYDDRKKVIGYLVRKMWTNPALLFYLLPLLRYQMNLRRNKGRKAKKARELIKETMEGRPSTEQIETDKEIMQGILNPKK